MQHDILVDRTLCIGCRACEKDCPVGNIDIKEGCAYIKDQACMKCGHCEAICPKAAIHIHGYEEEVENIQTKEHIDVNTLVQAIKSRRSIRQFKQDVVSEEKIKMIVEAGRYTPTAENKQEVSFIILQKDIQKIEHLAFQLLRKIWPLASLYNKAARNITLDEHFFFKKAPLVIMIVAHGSYAKVDGALAASNMALTAESQGLGVLYSGFFTSAVKWSRRLQKALQLKRKDHVIMTLVIGEPSVRYHRTAHKEKANVRYL